MVFRVPEFRKVGQMLQVEEIEMLLGSVNRSSAWGWMIASYLPAGPICPNCDSEISGMRALETFKTGGRVYCKLCSSSFVATHGTPIHGTSWQPEEFARLLMLHFFGRRPVDIADQLGKSAGSVRGMLDRYTLFMTSRIAQGI
jgi:hypothetical protein